MEITKKIIGIGESLGIIIDKVIIKKLELKKGDIITIQIEGGEKK